MNSYFYLEIALRIGEKGMQTEISIGITTINLAEELSNKLISKWKIFFSDRKSPLHFFIICAWPTLKGLKNLTYREL